MGRAFIKHLHPAYSAAIGAVGRSLIGPAREGCDDGEERQEWSPWRLTNGKGVALYPVSGVTWCFHARKNVIVVHHENVLGGNCTKISCVF